MEDQFLMAGRAHSIIHTKQKTTTSVIKVIRVKNMSYNRPHYATLDRIHQNDTGLKTAKVKRQQKRHLTKFELQKVFGISGVEANETLN